MILLSEGVLDTAFTPVFLYYNVRNYWQRYGGAGSVEPAIAHLRLKFYIVVSLSSEFYSFTQRY